jgi:hypothetical protein
MSDTQRSFAEISETVADLYRVISIKKGEIPDWEKFRSLFFPGAQLVSNSGETPVAWGVEKFISYYRERIKDKTVEEFQEGEIAQKTEIFGKIAHRFSTYEAKPYKRGINSIQLLKVQDKWLVTSLIWNDEQADLPIPEKYL